MEELQVLIGLGGAGVVLALVQAIKLACPIFQDGSKWEGMKPILAICVGVVWNVGVAWAIVSSGGEAVAYPIAAILGILTGLAASGLHSAQKPPQGSS